MNIASLFSNILILVIIFSLCTISYKILYKFQIKGLDAIFILSLIFTLVIMFFIYTPKNIIEVVEALKEVLKNVEVKDPKAFELSIKAIKDYFMFIVYLEIFIINFISYIIIFKFKDIENLSSIFLIVVLALSIIFLFDSKNILLSNLNLIMITPYCVYGGFVLNRYILRRINIKIISAAIVIFIIFIFPVALFVVGTLEIINNKKKMF